MWKGNTERKVEPKWIHSGAMSMSIVSFANPDRTGVHIQCTSSVRAVWAVCRLHWLCSVDSSLVLECLQCALWGTAGTLQFDLGMQMYTKTNLYTPCLYIHRMAPFIRLHFPNDCCTLSPKRSSKKSVNQI